MKVLFCETTSDITLLLSRKEAVEVRRSEGCIPAISGNDKGLEFYLTNSEFKGQEKPDDGIQVIEPRDPSRAPYFIKLHDDAYKKLLQDGKCGTRYKEASKVNVVIDD